MKLGVAPYAKSNYFRLYFGEEQRIQRKKEYVMRGRCGNPFGRSDMKALVTGLGNWTLTARSGSYNCV